MGMGVNNLYQFLPMRHIHTERSKICLDGCIIENYNQLANYALRISFALETTPLGMTQPLCTQPLFSLQVHTILISNCFIVLRHFSPNQTNVITLLKTHNKRSQEVLGLHECGPRWAQHTPLSATKNGLKCSLYGKTRRIAFAFITWLNKEQASRLWSSCRYPTPPPLPV